jgi:hypothetical protein
MISDKRIAILGEGRAGTTWVNSYVQKHNVLHKDCNVAFLTNSKDRIWVSSNEFLHSGVLPKSHKPRKVHRRYGFYITLKPTIRINELLTRDEKISFLEQERLAGLEYTYKHRVEFVHDIADWHKDFYKDWHVIKLKRRSLWDQFVSFMVQDKTGWAHGETVDIKFDISKNDITQFILNHHNVWEPFDDFYDEQLMYEDLNDDLLKEMFEISNPYHISKDVMNKSVMKARRDNYRNNINNYDEEKENFYQINKLFKEEKFKNG